MAGLAGSPWFPLPTGWVWSYTSPAGGFQTTEILGTIEVIGHTCAVRDVHVDVPQGTDDLVNYWSSDGDDVFLHGFTRDDGLQAAFDPPVLYIDPPLFVGKTWRTTFQRYNDLNGQFPNGDPVTVAFGVLDFAEITVPAGTFQAYKIGAVVPPGSAIPTGHDLLGRREDDLASGESTHDWVTAGVGPVRSVGSFLETFELVSYGGPVSVTEESWAAIKQRWLGDARD